MKPWVKVQWDYNATSWDSQKARDAQKKRGIHFAALRKTLKEGEGVERIDDREDYDEQRLQGMAEIEIGILFFAFTIRVPYTARIISARKANKREKKQFSEAMGSSNE